MVSILFEIEVVMRNTPKIWEMEAINTELMIVQKKREVSRFRSLNINMGSEIVSIGLYECPS